MKNAQRITNQAMVEALIASKGLISLAARRLGCSRQTIYNRAKRVQKVQQAIDDAREELVDIAELKLRDKIMDGEAWAVSLVLRTLGRNRGYVERQEVTGADGGPVVVDDERHTRALSTLADAIRESVLGEGTESDGAMGTAE